MGIEDKDTYYVAVKVFLEHDGKFFIFKDAFGEWDLPGGRITKDEFNTDLEDVVRRKMAEELGTDIEYKIDKPMWFMRHQRVEAVPGNPTSRIFGIGYPAILVRGQIHLSPTHTEMLWVDPTSFKPEEYFTGGWLKGVQEYLSSRNIS